MATNLFAMPSGGTGGNKPLLEFRAGKMNFSDQSKKVTPDKRKGLVQITQSVDGLIHFVWKDRTTGQTEQDLIIFPEEATFKHVKQCSSGRVYLLEFKTTSRKLFFWMQEPSDAKDEEHANKVNQYINNPPVAGEGNTGGASSGDQSAVMNMFAQRAQARGSGSSSGRQGNSGVVDMGDLQSILSRIGMPTSAISGMLGRQANQPPPSQRANPPSVQQTTPQATNRAPPPRLSTLLNPETVRPLLSNPSIQEQLLPFLPPERRTPEELRDIFNSPQFQQSLDAFGEALESGQLGELVRQFGLQSNGPTSIQQFLDAVQNATNQQGQGGQGSDQKPQKKDDDSMDT